MNTWPLSFIGRVLRYFLSAVSCAPGAPGVRRAFLSSFLRTDFLVRAGALETVLMHESKITCIIYLIGSPANFIHVNVVSSTLDRPVVLIFRYTSIHHNVVSRVSRTIGHPGSIAPAMKENAPNVLVRFKTFY